MCLMERVEGERRQVRRPGMAGPASALQFSGGQRQARKDGATANYRSGGGSTYSVLFMSCMDFTFSACI